MSKIKISNEEMVFLKTLEANGGTHTELDVQKLVDDNLIFYTEYGYMLSDYGAYYINGKII